MYLELYKNILDKNMEKQKNCRICNIFRIFTYLN